MNYKYLSKYHCKGKICCKLYSDKSQCQKVKERETNGVCDCRHARLLCELKPCVYEYARGSLHCSYPETRDMVENFKAKRSKIPYAYKNIDIVDFKLIEQLTPIQALIKEMDHNGSIYL